MSASNRISLVACLALALVPITSAVLLRPSREADREATSSSASSSASSSSSSRVHALNRVFSAQRKGALPEFISQLAKGAASPTERRPSFSGEDEQEEGQQRKGHRKEGEGRDGSPKLEQSKDQDEDEAYYDDGVYDLAHFWYNVEDLTYNWVDKINSTMLAKLARVNEKLAKMEDSLVEKDEQITSLHEAVAKLGSDSAEKEASLGDVRLFNHEEGERHVKGRLLIYAGAQLGWGFVCDDLFSYASATVACRQLGYSKGLVDRNERQDFVSSLLSSFVRQEYAIVLDNVECRAGAPDLLSCEHEPLGVHNCSPLEAVNIVCFR